MKETLSTIAQKTGLSVSTVSRVLSGKAESSRISEETIKLVLNEAKKSNYTPSPLARSLRTNKSNSIGLIIPQISNPFFADMAGAIISEAKLNGYTTILMDTMENSSNQANCISSLVSRKVDGIIISPCGSDKGLLCEINDNIMPVVCADRYFPNCNLPHVTSNNFKGAYEATEYLIGNGHKDIVCLRGDLDSIPCQKRVNGYLNAIKEHNLEDKATVVGNSFSVQNGYLETKLVMNREPRPTAILALSYTLLLGVIKAVRDSELSIPDDISIIAFDDNISMDYMTTPITRISQPVEEMGKLATKILLDSIESKKRSITKLELTTNMIIRDSVSKVGN